MTSIELSLTNDLDQIGAIEAGIERLAKRESLGDALCQRLNLVLDEWFHKHR